MSERKRVFMLVSYLVDDNDDMVTDPVPLAGTKSDKVAREVIQTFLNHRNTTCTPVWEKEIEHRLPGMIEKEVSSELNEILEAKGKSLLDEILENS